MLEVKGLLEDCLLLLIFRIWKPCLSVLVLARGILLCKLCRCLQAATVPNSTSHGTVLWIATTTWKFLTWIPGNWQAWSIKHHNQRYSLSSYMVQIYCLEDSENKWRDRRCLCHLVSQWYFAVGCVDSIKILQWSFLIYINGWYQTFLLCSINQWSLSLSGKMCNSLLLYRKKNKLTVLAVATVKHEGNQFAMKTSVKELSCWESGIRIATLVHD